MLTWLTNDFARFWSAAAAVSILQHARTLDSYMRIMYDEKQAKIHGVTCLHIHFHCLLTAQCPKIPADCFKSVKSSTFLCSNSVSVNNGSWCYDDVESTAKRWCESSMSLHVASNSVFRFRGTLFSPRPLLATHRPTLHEIRHCSGHFSQQQLRRSVICMAGPRHLLDRRTETGERTGGRLLGRSQGRAAGRRGPRQAWPGVRPGWTGHTLQGGDRRHDRAADWLHCSHDNEYWTSVVVVTADAVPALLISLNRISLHFQARITRPIWRGFLFLSSSPFPSLPLQFPPLPSLSSPFHPLLFPPFPSLSPFPLEVGPLKSSYRGSGGAL